MKVDFVTLGGASDRLDVPSPTLRNWTDQLEEFNTHYTKRNNRNERIYYQEDLDIFEYLRDLKNEYGRKTTTKDLARMLQESNRFELRSKEDAPSPIEEPSNRVELLSQEDIKELMDSERVKQFMQIIVSETTKNIKEDLVEEVTQSVTKELKKEFDNSEIVQKRTVDAVNEGYDKIIEKIERAELEGKKGFWARLMGK